MVKERSKRINSGIKNDKTKYNLRSLVREVLFKKHIIILSAVIGAIILLFINMFIIPPIYESTSKLYIVDRSASSMSKLSNLNISRMLTRDYTQLVRSNAILLEVINELDLDMDSTLLKEYITINAPKDTRMLEIRVVSDDPDLSKEIVDTLVKISAEEFTSITGIAKFNILEYGSPPIGLEPSDFLRMIMLGMCYGSFISILCIIRSIKSNECIRTADDIEYRLGLSTLAEIPLEKELKKENEKVKHRIKVQPDLV